MKRWFILLLMGAGLTLSASAQETVNGTVTDRKGVPMPGVRVSSTDKKVTAVALTELDGTFWLQSDRRPRKIVAEYVGFHARESRTKRNPLILKLKKESKLSYQGEISIGYAQGNWSSIGLSADNEWLYAPSDGVYRPILFEMIHGIRFNKYLFAGIGGQFEYSPSEEIASGAPFLNLKGYWPVTKKFMPYLSVSFGWGFSDGREIDLLEDQSAHDYVEFDQYFFGEYGIGFTVGRLNVGAGFQQKTFRMEYYDDFAWDEPADRKNKTMGSFYVKLGIKF